MKLSINDVIFPFPVEAGAHLDFTVSMDEPATEPIIVHAKTISVAARAGTNFKDTAEDIVFAPGETSKPFSVPLMERTALGQDLTFYATLSALPGHEVQFARATGAAIIEGNVKPGHHGSHS